MCISLCTWVLAQNLRIHVSIDLKVMYTQLLSQNLRTSGNVHEEPLGYIEGREIGDQGNYSPLLPHLLILEFASLCPFGAHNAALPNISFYL